MPDSPWVAKLSPAADRECLVLLSHLPLRRYTSLPRFLTYTREIQRQLAGTDGLVGYTLRARPLRRQFWTLSAWVDEAALRRFVAGRPHRDVMRRLAGHMGATDFVRWSLPGSALPPAWEDALKRGRA